MWVLKLTGSQRAWRNVVGVGREELGSWPDRLLPAAWLRPCPTYCTAGRGSLGFPGVGWGAGADPGTLHFQSILSCHPHVGKWADLTQTRKPYAVSTCVRMEGVAEVTYLLFIHFRIILFLRCHCLPALLQKLLFSLLENKYNLARSTLLKRISTVKPKRTLKKWSLVRKWYPLVISSIHSATCQICLGHSSFWEW